FSTLIRMTNSYGVQTPDGILIDLPLTDQKIGSFSATSRESVNRMLNELKRDGIISVKNGYITVHDLSYLRNEIDCDGCPIRSEEHTSELQSRFDLVCRLLLEKKKNNE